MNRLWPRYAAFGFLALLITIGAPRSNRPQSFLESFRQNDQHFRYTCYVCAGSLDPSRSGHTVTILFRNHANREIKDEVEVCTPCIAAYGWPLPHAEQETVRKHWVEKRIHDLDELRSSGNDAVIATLEAGFRNSRIGSP